MVKGLKNRTAVPYTCLVHCHLARVSAVYGPPHAGGKGRTVEAAQMALTKLAWYSLLLAEHCSNLLKRVPLIHTTGKPSYLLPLVTSNFTIKL